MAARKCDEITSYGCNCKDWKFALLQCVPQKKDTFEVKWSCRMFEIECFNSRMSPGMRKIIFCVHVYIRCMQVLRFLIFIFYPCRSFIRWLALVFLYFFLVPFCSHVKVSWNLCLFSFSFLHFCFSIYGNGAYITMIIWHMFDYFCSNAPTLRCKHKVNLCRM